MDARAWIAGTSLFGGLPDPVIDRIAGIASHRHYEARSVIYRRGDLGDSMSIVVSGRVVISSLSAQGSEVILNLIEPGEVHGEIAFLDGGERTATATTELASESLHISRRNFVPLLQSEATVAAQLLSVLCRRIRETTRFVEDAVLMDVPRRMFRRLEALAVPYGKPDGDGATRIEHRLSQQELADATGITRVSVNKTLMAWQRAGLLHHGRGWVSVLDWERLRTAVEAAEPD